MKAPRLLQRGVILWRRRSDPEAPSQAANALPTACPVAKCERCGYEFTPVTVSTVCPRCLEPFLRDPCYGGCFSCPLLPASAGESQ